MRRKKKQIAQMETRTVDCARLRQCPSKSIATGQIQRRAARISGTPTIADGSSRWAEEADKVNGSFDSRCCE